MGYCLPVLFRILGPKRFIQEFLASFTWRGSFNNVCHKRCDEYYNAYQTYSVHHKTYHDDSEGSISDKQSALQLSLSVYDSIANDMLNQSNLSDLCKLILSFSESELSEICYLFHVWKDNLLIPIKWHQEKIGPAWNIKTVFQNILKGFPVYKKSLKYNTNFRISMNIIERPDRLYNTMNEERFWKLINSKSDELSNGQMETMGYECPTVASLPIWRTAYPIIKIPTFNHSSHEWIRKQIELTDGNTFSNDEWIDYTQQMKCKLEAMNDDLFQKDCKVQISGLKSKPHWNGMSARIVSEYNFKRERWVVKIDKINQCAFIKTCNLQKHS